jgi:hypothetical protein
MRVFDTILCKTDRDLKTDTEFWAKHGAFLEANSGPRQGYGFWRWKSYLIMKTLERMEEGDVLVYADAGCTMNQGGTHRLNEYFEMVRQNEKGILAFQLTYPEILYTKSDVFEALGASEEEKQSNQLLATVIVLRKCAASMDFVKEWYGLVEDNHLVSDEPSVAPNHPDFKAARHDQSILSVLSKKRGLLSIPDETYFNPNWEVDGKSFPIWATRRR